VHAACKRGDIGHVLNELSTIYSAFSILPVYTFSIFVLLIEYRINCIKSFRRLLMPGPRADYRDMIEAQHIHDMVQQYIETGDELDILREEELQLPYGGKVGEAL
jgi:hypothetical protein